MDAEDTEKDLLERRGKRFFAEPGAEQRDIFVDEEIPEQVKEDEPKGEHHRKEEEKEEAEGEQSEASGKAEKGYQPNQQPEAPDANQPETQERMPESKEAPAEKRMRLHAIGENSEYTNRRKNIKTSVTNIIEEIIRLGGRYVGQLFDRETMKAIVDELDTKGTRKMQRQVRRNEAIGEVSNPKGFKDACDVAEIN